MSEENEDVAVEAAPEVVTPSEEAQESSQPEEQGKDPSQEKNWREVNRLLREQQLKIQELEAANAPKPKDELADLDEDDVVTVRDVKKLFATYEKGTMEERVETRYPDYKNVVQKYIPELIKENPALREAIPKSSNPYLTAYQLAKSSSHYYRDTNTVPESRAAEKARENLSKPVSSNTVGKSHSLDHAHDYANMSDREFWQRFESDGRRA